VGLRVVYFATDKMDKWEEEVSKTKELFAQDNTDLLNK